MVRPSVRRHAIPAVAVAVSLGEGRQPEHATTVRVSGTRDAPPRESSRSRADASALDTGVDPVAFEGPLALLLSLIEARQLDVLTVPLGGLAAAYLEAMVGLEGERLPYLSAFVTVAAQLILIKSRALLPRQPVDDPLPLADDGPDPEAALRRRLILYRAYRDAGQWLRDRSRSLGPLLRREPSVAQAAGLVAARAPAEPPLNPAVLETALRGAAQTGPPPMPSPEIVHRTTTLAERAEIIRAALSRAPVVVLQDLLGETADRVIAAVTFLAMLELVKRREIAVEQARPWGPIRCRALAGSAVVDASAPIDESLEDFA